MKVKTLRRLSQLLFFALFVWFLYEARRAPDGAGHSAGFLHSDPLSAFTAALAGGWSGWHYVFLAVIVVVLTLVLGRFFCGWICPLGTCVDAADKVLARRRSHYLPRRSWKYYLLAGVAAAALFGAQLGWWLDPLPLLERTLVIVFYPLVLAARNFPALHLSGLLDRVGLHLVPLDHPGFGLGLPVALVLLGILALGAKASRFFCRSFCPLGALFGLIGRFAPLRRRVTEECSSCGRCETTCKMGAILGEAPERTLTSECILCWNCAVCPSGTTTIGFRGPGDRADASLDTRKRALLGALGLGALSGLVVSTGLARGPRDNRLLRPPGANRRTAAGRLRRMDEPEFRGKCVRCGACMRACPTGGLQPAVAQAGFDGVFSPVLIPTVGWCEKSCTTCGEVCPTGALVPFREEEKPAIKLGLATVHHDRCLSWRQGAEYRRCLICAEVCPYASAVARQVEGEVRPVVIADLCTGCGLCENKCPIKPGSAIEVYRSDSQW